MTTKRINPRRIPTTMPIIAVEVKELLDWVIELACPGVICEVDCSWVLYCWTVVCSPVGQEDKGAKPILKFALSNITWYPFFQKRNLLFRSINEKKIILLYLA